MRLDGTWPIPSVSRLDLSALPIDVSDFQAIMCGALARDAAEVSTAGRAFSEGVSKVKVNIAVSGSRSKPMRVPSRFLSFPNLSRVEISLNHSD